MNATPSSVPETWSAFVCNAIGHRTNREVAELMELSESMIGNWVRGEGFEYPTAQNVVKFARIFHQPLYKALVAAGIGDDSDYGFVATRPDMSTLTREELLSELLSREQAGEEGFPKGRPRRTGARTAPAATETGRRVKLARASMITPL